MTGRAVLYRDTRYGEQERWVFGDPSEAAMKLPDDYKKCLGFIVSKKTVNKQEVVSYEGTGFFVSVPSEVHAEVRYPYLVTAKHVIVGEHGLVLPDLYLRMNLRAGGRGDIRLDGEWIFNDNRDIDVAVLQLTPNHEKFEWKHVPYGPLTEEGDRDNVFADEETIDSWGIGIGDELRVVGLFTKRTGNQQNIPITRSGIIAAMPDEPVEASVLRYGQVANVKFNAYLAEIRSIGGLSGSPVFVLVEHFRKPRKEGESRPLLVGIAHNIFLLGMIRGHWHYESQTSFIAGSANRPKDIEQVNMGMALVTPIQDVLDVLYDEGGEIMKERKRLDKEISRNKGTDVTEDSARRGEDVDLTKGDFEDALKQASRKVLEPSEPESKDSETSE